MEAHPALSQKKRNELSFRSAKVEIDVLRAKAAEGTIALAYVDEAGFSQVHPNRSAWTPRGERHLIEAKRGKRLNLLAALLSTGEVISAKRWQSTTAETFSGFLGLLKNSVQKPLTVILDNASIHKAKSLLIGNLPQQRRAVRLFRPGRHPNSSILCRSMAISGAKVVPKWDVHRLAEAGF